MRSKLLVGALVAAASALVPGALGSGVTTQALDCPGAAATACAGVGLVYGAVCYGTGTDVPTIGPVTIDVEGAPTVECPALPI
jgi:hypothetical protein